ncbi:MAG: hypothetical protein QF898_18730 [SAR202 cluster bacterium]|nr:hypothetical protein [SAR202 cluster bacterium]
MKNIRFEDGLDKEFGKWSDVASDIIATPMLEPEFCDYLIQQFEAAGFDRLPNYTMDCLMHRTENGRELCMSWLNAIKKVIEPKIVDKWTVAVMARTHSGYAIPFCKKYAEARTPYQNMSLALHNDHALFTLGIRLNDGYEGSETIFPRQGFNLREAPVGMVAIWPGTATHPHYAGDLKAGVKYTLVGRMGIVAPRGDECDDIEKFFRSREPY